MPDSPGTSASAKFCFPPELGRAELSSLLCCPCPSQPSDIPCWNSTGRDRAGILLWRATPSHSSKPMEELIHSQSQIEISGRADPLPVTIPAFWKFWSLPVTIQNLYKLWSTPSDNPNPVEVLILSGGEIWSRSSWDSAPDSSAGGLERGWRASVKCWCYRTAMELE